MPDYPKEFQEVLDRVQEDYKLGGLSDGLYADYAWDCFKEYSLRKKKRFKNAKRMKLPDFKIMIDRAKDKDGSFNTSNSLLGKNEFIWYRCTNCKGAIYSDNKFCHGCGYEINWMEEQHEEV